MSNTSMPTVLGCLINVSKSMREAFEARGPTEPATE
jgi:hypothetical protein